QPHLVRVGLRCTCTHDSMVLSYPSRFTRESGTRACAGRGYSPYASRRGSSLRVVADDPAVSYGTVEEGVDPRERDRQRYVPTASVIIRGTNEDRERDGIVGLADLDTFDGFVGSVPSPDRQGAAVGAYS